MASKSLTSLDLYKLTQEIGYINGGFIRNVKSGKNEVYFLIFCGKEVWLKMVPGSHISISQEKPEETTDYPFTGLLKSVFKGRRVKASMHESDRIFELKSDDFLLSLELFSKGNLILSKDGKIVQSLYNRNYSGRKVSADEIFSYPPGKANVFSMDLDAFTATVKASEREDIVKTLAIELSLGGEYAEEVCFRAGVDKNMPQMNCSDENLRKIFSSLEEIIKKEVRPNIIDGKLLSVIELKHIQGDKEYFDDINSAVRAFFSAPEKDVRREKIEKDNEAAKKSIVAYSSAIDYIVENYEDVSRMIEAVRDSKTDIEKRKEMLKVNGWSLEGRFLKKDDSPDIKIDITRPLRDYLNELYTKKKRLSRAVSSPVKVINRPKRVKVTQSPAWYSKFRWFITSHNRLVVIGRDVNQNNSLIDKHVEKDDIVVHADVFGSPFGVVKNGANADEKDIDEACRMVASYSSAWKAGATNLDVYFVYPNQVTKTPPSGESLKKGAFYIDGKKNYVKNVSLGLYIAFSPAESEIGVGISASEPKNNFVLIKPGNKKREEVIKKIIKKLEEKMNITINPDEIDRLLPQGKCSIEKLGF